MTVPRSEIRRSSARARVVTVRPDGSTSRLDRLAAEEPMEIRAGGPGQEAVSVAITMRTPGNDFELAAGFLFTEGLVGPADVGGINYCEVEGEQEYNVVTVRTRRPVDPSIARRTYASSSCGICGKGSLDDVEVRCAPIADGPAVASSVITSLPAALGERQRIFAETGGLHAAGLFHPAGDVRAVREDVGRHNAVDKLVGAAILERSLPLSSSILMVSGRIGFEILQKAAVAGIPIVCAVSAPSSLAVSAGERLGVTVVGFLRGDSFNVYSHPKRIEVSA